MPNHYHLLMRQKIDRGVSRQMADTLDSFTKYYNLFHQREGCVFGRFKATEVRTTEQFVHVSRYIHLNPVTAKIVKKTDILKYPWSSLQRYVIPDSPNDRLITKELLFREFDYDCERYKKFVLDNVDYQRKLHIIKKNLKLKRNKKL